MEIKCSWVRRGGWGDGLHDLLQGYSIVTPLEWHLERARRKMLRATTERYYEMDIPAHTPPSTHPPPHLTESNHTGQVPLQMKRSLSRDKDWNILYVANQDCRIILEPLTGETAAAD